MPNDAMVRLKQKYPQYANIPDEILAQKIVDKHPQYREAFSELLQPEPQSAQASSTGVEPFKQTPTGFQRTNFGDVQREQLKSAITTGVPLAATLVTGGGSMIPSWLVRTAAMATAGAGSDLAATSIDRLAGKKITNDEQATSAMKQGIFSGALNVAGEATGGVLSKFFSNRADPEMIAMAEKAGIPLRPSEAVQPGIPAQGVLRGVEGAVDRLPTSRTIGGNMTAERVDQLTKMGRETADQTLGTYAGHAQMKQSVNKAIDAAQETFRDAASKKYQALDAAVGGMPTTQVNMGPGTPGKLLDAMGNPIPGPPIMKSIQGAVSTASVKAFAEDVINGLPEPRVIAARKGGADASALFNQMEEIRNLPEQIPFKDAQSYRSQLLATVRQDKSPIGGQIAGTAGKVADLLDGAMGSAAKNAGGDVYKLYRDASDYWKQGKELFNNSFIKGIAEREPERLATDIISPKNAERINMVKKAIDPGTWQEVKRAAIEDWLTKSEQTYGSAGDKYINGKSLIDNWKKLGEETKAAAFTQPERDVLEKYANFVSRVPSRPIPSITGMGATVGMATGAILAGGVPGLAVELLAPPVIAKMIYSSAGRKLLTEGMAVSPAVRDVFNFGGRLGAYLDTQKSSPRKETKGIPPQQ